MESLKQEDFSKQTEEKKELESLPSLSSSSSDAAAKVVEFDSDNDKGVVDIIEKEFGDLGLEENERLNPPKNLQAVVAEVNQQDVENEIEQVKENLGQNQMEIGEGGVNVSRNGNGWRLDINQNPNGNGWTVDDSRYRWNAGNGGDNYVPPPPPPRSLYPLRPGEADCVFYLKTGSCGFGYNCKFNHPPTIKHKLGFSQLKSSPTESEDSAQVVEEKVANHRRVGRLECKYYLSPGGCKFGKACRYNHSREKTVAERPADVNFLGLPIRPGERECPFYMRTGSCKFATNCRFHHPDPTAGGMDSGYDISSSIPLQPPSVSQPVVTSWSIPQPSTDTVSFSDTSRPYMPMMLQPRGVHPGLEWSGYQAPLSPLYPPQDGMMRPSMASSGPNKNANGYTRPPQQAEVESYPERPGQKECQYYMNTGECKYKFACRFHHPKTRNPNALSLSPMGLPLRPDQTVCLHFSRYGICKYGAACKYDHTPNPNSSITPAPYAEPNMEDYGGDGSKSLVEQLV